MAENLKKLLEELKYHCSVMSPNDSEEEKDVEERLWCESLTKQDIDVLLNWLVDDPVAYCIKDRWPQWQISRVINKACQVCGRGENRLKNTILPDCINDMLDNKNTAFTALEIISEWANFSVLPKLREIANNTDDLTFSKIASAAGSIKHTNALNFLYELKEKHKTDDQKMNAIAFAIAEYYTPTE